MSTAGVAPKQTSKEEKRKGKKRKEEKESKWKRKYKITIFISQLLRYIIVIKSKLVIFFRAYPYIDSGLIPGCATHGWAKGSYEMLEIDPK